MSRLAKGDDDHPEAALKNLRDAQVLNDAARFDGAAYLSGYAVECSFKTILLFQQSVDATTGAVDTSKLNTWHAKLKSKKFGHNLVKLLSETATASSAKYVPHVPIVAAILGWTETIRYSPAGRIGQPESRGYLTSAEEVTEIVVQMKIDGVL